MHSIRIAFITFLVCVAACLSLATSAAAQSLAPVQTDISSLAKLPQNTGGNVLEKDGQIQYQWLGIYFEARFFGPQVYFKIDDNYNRFRVLLDAKEIAIIEKPSAATYLASDLGQGEHTIRLEKLSESQSVSGSFFGFFVPEESKQLPPIQRSRKIEFIGDSYLVGYGNLSNARACPGTLYQNTDNTKSYGQIVARHFNADFQVNAYSGIGMARNYNNNMGENTMGYFYPRQIFDQETKSQTNSFAPDIILIALGTNDFSTPIKVGEKWKSIDELKQDYIAKHLAFLAMVRAQNPNATILMATNIAANPNHLAAREIIAKKFAKSDSQFYPVFLPKLQNTGCDWHPNLNDHLLMAQIIISKINELRIDW